MATEDNIAGELRPRRETPAADTTAEARRRIEAAYRRRWGDASRDIASEAIARALKSFDPARGIFSSLAFACARNVAREYARKSRRDRGEPAAPRVPEAELWVELLEGIEPSAFAQWFRHALLGLTPCTSVAECVDRAATYLVLYVRDDLAGEDGDWSAIHRVIVSRTTVELAARSAPPTAEDVLRTSLSAMGVRGQGFDRWLKATYRQAEAAATRVAKEARVPEQVDVMQAFIAARLDADPDGSVPAADLRSSYEAFCRANDSLPIDPTEFGRLVASLDGVSRRRGSRGNSYVGIRLRPLSVGGG